MSRKGEGQQQATYKQEAIYTRQCFQELEATTVLGGISCGLDQFLDPLSHTTLSASSNKSRSLETPMADPCC